MKRVFKSWSEFYQQINLVFNAIIAFSLLPFGWLMLEMEGKGEKDSLLSAEMDQIVIISLTLLIVVIAGLARKGAVSRLDKLDESDLSSKLIAFYRIFTGYYIKLEVAATLAFVGGFITRSYVFIVLYVAILFFFSFIRPTYDLVVKKLGLSSSECEQIEQEETL